MKVYPWLIDLIRRRKNFPTGMISGWVQKSDRTSRDKTVLQAKKRYAGAHKVTSPQTREPQLQPVARSRAGTLLSITEDDGPLDLKISANKCDSVTAIRDETDDADETVESMALSRPSSCCSTASRLMDFQVYRKIQIIRRPLISVYWVDWLIDWSFDAWCKNLFLTPPFFIFIIIVLFPILSFISLFFLLCSKNFREISLLVSMNDFKKN